MSQSLREPVGVALAARGIPRRPAQGDAPRPLNTSRASSAGRTVVDS
jgi:hypothetical protein